MVPSTETAIAITVVQAILDIGLALLQGGIEARAPETADPAEPEGGLLGSGWADNEIGDLPSVTLDTIEGGAAVRDEFNNLMNQVQQLEADGVI